MAIIDNNYLLGPPNRIFPIKDALASDLAEVGLELQPRKSKCYIADEYRDAEWDRLRGEVPNGVLKETNGDVILKDGLPIHGITACNVPVGSAEFTKGYL